MQGIYYFQDGKVFHACREANSGDVITLCEVKVRPTDGPIVMRGVQVTCPKCSDIIEFERCQRGILIWLGSLALVSGLLLLILIGRL